ncbi:MAG: phospholipase [Actinobacteria bacterium]|nr:phospholipase [Actinomycetota bacterium]MBI3688547.1 phospholipase [Actinomycetota bacterium]
MSRRRLSVALAAVLLSLLALVGTAVPAQAVTLDEKLQVMSAWTQPTQVSTGAWNAGRLTQPAWSAYTFDWSTDYCSVSPDQPLGFDFRLPCWHHDWGYRNYKTVGQFPANKPRVDDMFYFHLRQVCASYPSWKRPTCDGLAWSYYQAVRTFGSLSAVSQLDLDRAAIRLALARRWVVQPSVRPVPVS